MSALPPSLRKAAILISTLDARAADTLLDQMDPAQARIVRSAVLSLGEVSAEEQRQVLEEFFRQQPRKPGPETDGVELELSTVVDPPGPSSPPGPELPTDQGVPSVRARREAPADSDAERPSPLAFLREVEATALAEVLRREHPQTSAVVLAHLPPAQAAAVLEQLPPELATEALARMAHLGPMAPEVLDDLAQALQLLLAPLLPPPSALEKLSAVLAAMEAGPRAHVLAQLARRHSALGRRLRSVGRTPSGPEDAAPPGPETFRPAASSSCRYRLERPVSPPHTAGPMGIESPKPGAGSRSAKAPRWELGIQSQGASAGSRELEDARDPLALLERLEDPTLQKAAAGVDLATLALALLGAPSSLVDRVLRLLPPAQAAQLRTRLERPGPVRLGDLEEAQRRWLAAVGCGWPAAVRPPRRSPAETSAVPDAPSPHPAVS